MKRSRGASAGQKAAEPGATNVVIYPAPEGEPASGDYAVEVNGRPVFVYSATVLTDGPASFAYFDFTGVVRVTVTPTRRADTAVIRPRSFGLTPTVEGGSVRFELDRPRNLSLELNDGAARPLFLFAGPIETDRPDPKDPSVLYFGPGVHEIAPVKIESGRTVYIAGGAVVRGKMPPGEKQLPALLSFRDVRNVAVRGRGILDLSAIPLHAMSAINFTNCSDFRIEGIILRDSPGWCVPMFGCRNGAYVNLKEICHRENSDGINIVNTQDVVVDGCFQRVNDDVICVKTTAPPPAQDSRNILAKDCVVWNDRACALGVTYETRCDVEGVTFRNCDIIHDWGKRGSMGIRVSDSGTVSNVRFEDIRVEDERDDFIWLIVRGDCWAHDTERGHVRGVAFRNVSLTGGPAESSRIEGCDETHLIEDVTIENISLHGRPARDLNEAKIAVNPHTRNIRVIAGETPS